MAGSGELTAGAVALQRFGLGPKPGRGEAARAQIRETILAEIAAGSVAQPAGVPFSGAAEIGKALYDFEDQQRQEREARRVAVAPPPSEWRQACRRRVLRRRHHRLSRRTRWRPRQNHPTSRRCPIGPIATR